MCTVQTDAKYSERKQFKSSPSLYLVFLQEKKLFMHKGWALGKLVGLNDKDPLDFTLKQAIVI